MPQAVTILFGAAFTVLTSVALGKLLLRGLKLRFYRIEEHLFAFFAGSACLSAIMFALAAAQAAYTGVFLAVGLAAIGAAILRGAHRPEGDRLPGLSRPWKAAIAVLFGLYTVLYLANAMAPEMSPDGSAYHLGLVARYLREHGFSRLTTNMYGNLSQGVEMLFLFAFSLGRHSAAALVHFSFLVALPAAMLAYAKRFGFPPAGAVGALLFYMSPVAGIDGISAYNDVAVAAILFAVFYLVQIWDEERNPALLIPIGLLAGFAYAAKYTAFLAVPYALGFIVWRLWRERRPWLKPALVVSLCAAVMILPWMAKNWVVVQNPVSPFFNSVFPNPYVHVSFEKGYAEDMRNYTGLNSYWEIPLEVTVRGRVLCGLLGPVFLLSPLALLVFRERAGRRLLAAGVLFGLTYFANIGTRFLIPPLPYVSLALGMVLVRAKVLAPLVVIVHALLSWPSHINMYSDRYAWRLEKIFWKQALRIMPEEQWLDYKFPGYGIARMIEQHVPEGDKVLAVTQVPESYTSRDILVAYQAAFNHTMGDILWTPLIDDVQPTWHLTFRFPAQRVRKLRVVQTAEGGPDLWSVSELRVFHGDRELPREPRWRLRAHPNPWDVQMAFDNSPATRWRSWQSLFPGMFIEIDFGRAETADRVVLECSHDQYKIRLKLERQDESGQWIAIADEPEANDRAAPLGLRRAAAEELKLRGIRYLLAYDFDFGAEDFRTKASLWGITFIAERNGARLYRID